jgi:bifunctional UDP-N-acetylglucosamine pyrophosphorylase/glucosamine-1-phosphate N-acetyltransferase
MTDARPAAVVVLAAGEGTRMRSSTAKVLHSLGGKSMVAHVVGAARALDPQHLVVVVGHAREQVIAHLKDVDPATTTVVQEQQNGTGHAVRVALEGLEHLEGTVVVVPGDTPLLTAESLRSLVSAHEASGAATTMLTSVLEDATGYGRVVRDGAGAVLRITEHRDIADADAQTLEIREVNTSVYAFSAGPLREALSRLGTDNAQGEEYLTDVVAIHREAGLTLHAVSAPATETAGVNDRAQLAEAAAVLRDRINAGHLRAGVAILDPATTWIDATVELAPDCVIKPQTQLHGRTTVARGAVVGPDTTLVSTAVGEGASVVRTHADSATIGAEATVGPFSYLRPGAVLGVGAKVGAFVEVKGSTIGDGSKVPHLSYVGDTTIGERSNLGAGTVTVNYDGFAKHRTTIGDDVRIGSDTMLVAPVAVGDGAVTGAGSTITEDVPADALALGRARQTNIQGWAARNRERHA